MIPLPFDYVRASTPGEAVALLRQYGEDARLLAGGHSLLPLMKLRLAAPAVVVDIGQLGDLAYVRAEGDHIAIGALTRHRELETSPVVRLHAPLLAAAAGRVGDPQVRHRGTIGGSLAHADPAADLPAVLLALDASLVIQGPAGQRVVPAASFATGFLETALAADELLLEVRIPHRRRAGWSFQKLTRRTKDWAIVGVACCRSDAGTSVALVNMGATPLRARAVERALADGAAIGEAAALADRDTAPPHDVAGSADYRRHVARVLVGRALREAAAAG